TPAVPSLQFILRWSLRSRQLKSKASHTYIIDYIEPICETPCFFSENCITFITLCGMVSTHTQPLFTLIH
ncbi:Os11g0454701, partial [Oryza sativa Japonica Group]